MRNSHPSSGSVFPIGHLGSQGFVQAQFSRFHGEADSKLEPETAWAELGGFVTAWQELGSRKFEALKVGGVPLRPLAVGAHRLLQRYLRASERFQEMVDGGDHNLEQNLERASDARDKALEAASAKWESKDIPAWAITLQDSLRALHQGFGVPMAEAVTSALETRTEAVAKAQEALSKVAGGAKNGELWHSTKAPGTPILEHFVATLDKFLAKPESFQHLIDNLQAAVNKCKSLRAQYVDLLADADHQDITGEALKCLQRAHMTKLEVKCARCLRKSNQKKDKLQRYTADFVKEAATDWQDLMQPDLYQQILAILG